MTAHAVPRNAARPKRRHFLLPLAGLALVAAAAVVFVAYVLWPTWPDRSPAGDAPDLPITVAGVLFDVPPAAIRAKVQRHPGDEDRIDLAFAWPSLKPPPADDKPDAKTPLTAANAAAAAAEPENQRLFVTIAGRGNELPPLERLRTIYPRYAETQASAGPAGLAVLPFRPGTPYDGEDLVYVGDNPEQFFALCTRPGRTVPGTCIHERSLGSAEITFRFPRDWFGDWHDIAGGFDRLMARLRPQHN
ncbi:MAG TPA: hypothetical protein VMC05_11975 [Xanthobacteraceae bacterium]|nr:hypothetical protein [Xanthobacteraceae bacterium]